MKNTFLGSEKLFELGEKIGFTCLDLGTRHNFIADMLPLAPHINAIGFDADKEECSRLNAVIGKEGSMPWKSRKYIPTAIASKEEKDRDFYSWMGLIPRSLPGSTSHQGSALQMTNSEILRSLLWG